MNHFNFQLFTILQYLEKPKSQKWNDYKVVLAKNKNNQHRNAGLKKKVFVEQPYYL